MPPNLQNKHFLDHLIELLETVYSKPTSPIILSSILADDIEVESL